MAVLSAGLATGACWRLRPVGEALLFGDELHSLRLAERGYGAILTTFSATGSGMALPLLQRVLTDLFGSDPWTLRAPAWIPGLLLLAWVLPALQRLHGRAAAAAAALLVAVNPMLVFYAHFGRSYALLALLCFALWVVIERALQEGALLRRREVAVAVLCALLPYIHLSAGWFTIPVVVAGTAALFLETRDRGAAVRLARAGAAGSVFAGMLHLPALPSFAAFVHTKTTQEYFGSFAPLDVAALLVGTPALAPAALLLTLAALLAFAVQRRHRALPLVTACLAPPLALAILRPYGDAYAYARYLIAVVPPACAVLGWAVQDLACRSVAAPHARDPATLAVGAALALAVYASGPLLRAESLYGPHANTYLNLLVLPDFDRPWPGAPPFYAELAGERRSDGARPRIIEAPALAFRSRHLYRNYWLGHRAPTRVAFAPSELERPPNGYASLADLDSLEHIDADYLILHLDVHAELLDYWSFVYGRGLDAVSGPRRAYMERHARFGTSPPLDRDLIESLEHRLGPPLHRDRRVAVWRLSGG